MADSSVPIISDKDVIAASKACNAESNWDTSAFERLLERGWDINSSYGHIGDALCLAVSANKPHLVQYLLSKGSSPNANLRGETHTPLELACVVSADQEIVSLLLAHGSIVRGRSAAYLAAKTGRVDILETLLSPTTTTNNANASGSGNDTINLLNSLPSNDDVYDNARAQRDWGTPLHGAVGANQVAVVRWLLSRGADPAVRNYVGLTPKELADEKGFEECSKILSSSGGGEGDGL